MEKIASVQIKRFKIQELQPHPDNPRIHPEKGSEEWEILKKSLEFDYFDPVVFNIRNHYLVSGHLRIKILQDNGVEEVDAVVVDYEEPIHLLRMIAANKLIGRNDLPKLAEMLKKFKEDSATIALTGYTTADITDVLDKFKRMESTKKSRDRRTHGDRGTVYTNTKNIENGDLIKIGKHKLLCGDSTKSEDIKKVLQEDKINLLLEDPPYGMNYVGITNDSPDSSKKVLVENLFAVIPFLKNGGAFYIFSCDFYLPEFVLIMKQHSELHIQPPFLIWLKNRHNFNRSDYHPKTENIIYGIYDNDVESKIVYGWKEGEAHHFVKDRTQSNIFEYDRPHVSEGYQTIKPIDLLIRLITNSSNVDEIVFDGFSGSGSTLFSCQESDRIFRGIEIEPKYISLTIDHAKEVYGIEAEIIKATK